MKEKIRAMVHQGLTHAEIAQETGKTRSSVADFCSRFGITRRINNPKKDVNLEQLKSFVADDMQTYKMAEILGCSVSTVERVMARNGLKKKRTGPKSGDRHTGWKGGTMIVKGYRYIYSPDHPNKTKKGYVSEHRLVMEKTLGRLLHQKEVVHHKDGDRLNNDASNLAVYPSNGEHLREHLEGCPIHAQKCREGFLKHQQQKRTQIESELGGLSGTQPIAHQTS